MSKHISVRKTLVKDHHKALKTLAHMGPKKALVIVNNSPNKFLHVIRTLAKFTLDGTIPLEKHHVKKLQRHKQIIRNVAKSRSARQTKEVLKQKGGSFFKTVLSTLLPLIPMIL
jgi:MinD superfamily P-loop ATPase